MAIAYGDHSLSQIADANANTEWSTSDAKSRSTITTTFACMASGYISTTEAGDTFISLLRVHIEMFGILKQYKQREAAAMIKITRRMEKIAEHLRKLRTVKAKIEIYTNPHLIT